MIAAESRNFIYMAQWIQRQLDLDRPCGMVSSDETCWLCDDFVAWNSVMQEFDLELAETRPGTLLLQTVANRNIHRYPLAITFQASFLASWLLRHHPCIQELSLACCTWRRVAPRTRTIPDSPTPFFGDADLSQPPPSVHQRKT
ncbi:hypothetical protein MTO96_008342 [Rhipicephalus appendiculatus]